MYVKQIGVTGVIEGVGVNVTGTEVIDGEGVAEGVAETDTGTVGQGPTKDDII